ncbi:cytochrome c oxidase accessory protein CcoG [Hirschia baltica]|uniref:Cytochrome c oxidase accessory protein CcoG n=1 Tax=Hirschia baltica (strain ATCC 49814 / DSM 5838 / IFAM 1418) TaxID=582402 RepID=C6XJR8_HIRBI|nr:cytochrome c oxidase accessory protein CcoG [Hirschia baltica]ACT59363.1 cytochrome c oxidase accessory protein CcoG [Hirschia baltica ATCC 49814]
MYNNVTPPPPGQSALYKAREPIYPQLVSGKFRTIKWVVLVFALAVYYILPWLRWDRGLDAPNQAVLADFAGGRFYFFFLEIWPQEIYYITGLLILASLGLFLVTSLFGRVWCGYACPQTVWTDLFIAVERIFEGDRNARIKLDRAPLSVNKALRKVGKHIVWLFISFATGGALILYYHDAPTLFANFFTGDAEVSAYVFAGILTFTTYALAGTMREQVCTYLCPWPRIQAALTDEHALNVTYRWDRGEPRGAHKKNTSWDGRGDCIDCNACVVACPVGIDIRHGAQLECIHCALCIDACDTIMKRVDRPTGLIAYDTDKNVQARSEGKPAVYNMLRPRVILYAFLIAAISCIMVYGLSTRSTFELNVIKDRSPPFVKLSNGDIRNGYSIKLVNKKSEDREVLITASGINGLDLKIIGNDDTDKTIIMSGEHVDRFRILITVPEADKHKSGKHLIIEAKDVATGDIQSNRVFFAIPKRDD